MLVYYVIRFHNSASAMFDSFGLYKYLRRCMLLLPLFQNGESDLKIGMTFTSGHSEGHSLRKGGVRVICNIPYISYVLF